MAIRSLQHPPGAPVTRGVHDPPSAAQLVQAVREWLDRDVVTAVSGRLKFHTRVASNVLAIVERELELGSEQAEAHRARLAALGVADEADLAAQIRSGALDDRLDEVRAAVWETVQAKLAVANPRYAEEEVTRGGR